MIRAKDKRLYLQISAFLFGLLSHGVFKMITVNMKRSEKFKLRRNVIHIADIPNTAAEIHLQAPLV